MSDEDADKFVHALARDWRSAPLSQADQALCGFAAKLTNTSSQMSPADLDGLRQKALLREFGEYLQGKGRLRVFRSEAVRAGFSHAWKERDYNAILKVAERLPETVLQEDQHLLMYVHNAALRQEEHPRQLPLI